VIYHRFFGVRRLDAAFFLFPYAAVFRFGEKKESGVEPPPFKKERKRRRAAALQKGFFMYPHRIRLRGPWDYETLVRHSAEELLTSQGRMILPARWADARLAGFSGKVRFTRRFGYPGQIDADERVWLTCAGLADGADIFLNDTLLAHDQDGRQPFEFDITSLLRPRNELKFEVTGSAAGGLWGEVALEIRCTAFLRDVSFQPVWVNGHLELEVRGIVAGTSEGELEVYTVLNRRQAVYGRLTPSAAGQAFCLCSVDLPTECWRGEDEAATGVDVRIDLVKGATVWYTVTQELLLPFRPVPDV